MRVIAYGNKHGYNPVQNIRDSLGLSASLGNPPSFLAGGGLMGYLPRVAAERAQDRHYNGVMTVAHFSP